MKEAFITDLSRSSGKTQLHGACSSNFAAFDNEKDSFISELQFDSTKGGFFFQEGLLFKETESFILY